MNADEPNDFSRSGSSKYRSISHGPKIMISKSIYHVVTTVTIVQSLLTAATSDFVALYSRSIGCEHLLIRRMYWGGIPKPPTLVSTMLIPRRPCHVVRLGQCCRNVGREYRLGLHRIWAS